MAFLAPHETDILANESGGEDFSLLFNDFAASDEGLAWLTEGALENQSTNALPRPVPTDMSTDISKPTREILHRSPPPLIPSQFQQPTNPIQAERPVNWTTKSSPSNALGNRDFATKASPPQVPPPAPTDHRLSNPNFKTHDFQDFLHIDVGGLFDALLGDSAGVELLSGQRPQKHNASDQVPDLSDSSWVNMHQPTPDPHLGKQRPPSMQQPYKRPRSASSPAHSYAGQPRKHMLTNDSTVTSTEAAPIWSGTGPPIESGVAQAYRCAFCCKKKSSNGATVRDGWIIIECECGGQFQDGKSRVHSAWFPITEVPQEGKVRKRKQEGRRRSQQTRQAGFTWIEHKVEKPVRAVVPNSKIQYKFTPYGNPGNRNTGLCAS